MTGLGDADLAEILASLARVAAQAANDITVELETAERTDELASICGLAEQLLRERAQRMTPRVVEGTERFLTDPRPRFSASGP